jgi:hypothetical protein
VYPFDRTNRVGQTVGFAGQKFRIYFSQHSRSMSSMKKSLRLVPVRLNSNLAK